jgi:hypothetical protein
MDRVIFVELLDRRGDVVRRERVTTLPARIGRAYDSDVIIDDPHVCRTHALLEDTGTGALQLRDLDSLNGLVRLPSREHVNVVSLSPDTVVQLGRTQLRVRDAAHAVADSIRISKRPHLVEWSLNHWTAALAWVVLLLVVGIFGATREATADIRWTWIATVQGSVLLAILAWAGAWGLVTRLMTHRSRFVAHLAISVLSVIASQLQHRIFGLAQFLFAPIGPLQIGNQLGTSLVFAAAIFAHLSVLAAGPVARRVFAAAGVGVAVLALGLANDFAEEPDWLVTLPYWSRLEPVPAAWLPVDSPEAFFADVEGMEAELQSLRAELAQEGSR